MGAYVYPALVFWFNILFLLGCSIIKKLKKEKKEKKAAIPSSTSLSSLNNDFTLDLNELDEFETPPLSSIYQRKCIDTLI